MNEKATGLMAVSPDRGQRLAPESVPLTGVRVDVSARGSAAAVTVTQRYVNREQVPVEAVYSFPLEERAAVYGFEALIGERRIVGHVAEAEAAFEEYDQAMAQGHGAYLLDQDRPNLFTASVGNLAPGQEAVITLRYVAPLERQIDRVRLKLPTTVAPRYIPVEELRRMDPVEFDHLAPPTVFGGVPYGLSLSIDFEGGAEVTAVECASHPVRVRVEGRQAHVELCGDDVQLDQDFVVSFMMSEGQATSAQAARDDRNDLVLMFEASPPDDARRPPVEAIFLIDRSGSMDGSSIVQARHALLLALNSLGEGDRFNVYGFGSVVDRVFPDPVPYDDVHLEQARRVVQAWDADLGGTELLTPLQEIVAGRAEGLPRRVLLLTDGEVSNEEECAALVAAHAMTTTIFTVGVGYGASDYLISTLARASQGAAETVHPNERIEPVVMRQMARLRTPALRDVCIDWAGLPVDLAAPAVPPALFPGTPFTVYARVPAARLTPDMLARPAELTLTASVADRAVRLSAVVDLATAPHDAALPRLFAREAIRDLEEGRAGVAGHGSQQRTRTRRHDDEAIRELGERYTLLSSQTSFVAVEEREAAEGEAPPAELRRIPVALLKDWHGIGTGCRAAFAPAAMPQAPLSAPTGVLAPPAVLGAPPAQRRGALRFKSLFGAANVGRAVPRRPHVASDPLIALVGDQHADGSWPWRDELAARVAPHRDELFAQFASLCVDQQQREEVFPTLLVLALLRRDYAGREDEWRLLADKALAWLAAHGVCAPPGSESLEEWLAQRLRA
jgi:Ca-activated chloride channel family protein